MTARERVLLSYPKAMAGGSQVECLVDLTYIKRFRGVVKATVESRFSLGSALGDSITGAIEAAWQNAAESLPPQPVQEDELPMMDYEDAGKEAYAEGRVISFRADPTGTRFEAHPDGSYVNLDYQSPKPVEPLPPEPAQGTPWPHLPHATVTVDKETNDKLTALAKRRSNGYMGDDPTPEPLASLQVVCIHCGPTCIPGAAHNARAEDGVIWEPKPTPSTRLQRQRLVGDWCVAAFGEQEALSLPQRGIRLLEEAAEAAQATGVDLVMAEQMVRHVWSRPAGALVQELGGVGVTALAGTFHQTQPS